MQNQPSKEFFDDLLKKLANEQGMDAVPTLWTSIVANHCATYAEPEEPKASLCPGYYLGHDSNIKPVTAKLHLVEEIDATNDNPMGFSLIYGRGDWCFNLECETADEVANAFSDLEGNPYASGNTLLGYIARAFHIMQQDGGTLYHRGIEISANNMEQTGKDIANPEWVVNTGGSFEAKHILKDLIGGEE